VAGLATTFGSGAMTNSIADLANDARCYFVIGSNTTEQHPVIGIKIRQAVRKRGAVLIVADPRRIDLVDYATLHLAHRPGTDIALLNGIAHVLVEEGLYDRDFVALRTECFDDLRAVLIDYTPARVAEITGVPAADIVQAAHLLAENRPGALVYAMGITQHITGTHNVMACANLQMLLGNMGVAGGGVNPLRGQNNVQGACDMGGLPNVYPAYQVVTNPEVKSKFEKAWGVSGLPDKVGMTVTEMLPAAHDGRLRALYVMGEDPLMSDADLTHARESLEKLDFLVVQDIFPTATSQIADVVLPAPSFAEKDGTFTNTERRVQRVRPAVPPPGDVRQDWQVFCELATRMGYPMHYDSPARIMEEIATVAPSYGGIRHERLEKGGLQWPCPNLEHPGTPILHVGKFARGVGRFMAVQHLPPNELPDAEYPLVLTTGRVLFHYHGGEMSRRSAGLDAIYPQARVEISPEDAQRLGVGDGKPVRVTSRRGEIVAQAWVTERTQPGLIFIAFHFAEAAANLLTNAALDPISKIPEYKVCAVRVAPA
jgi:formate dehydrogenase alpha subunit